MGEVFYLSSSESYELLCQKTRILRTWQFFYVIQRWKHEYENGNKFFLLKAFFFIHCIFSFMGLAFWIVKYLTNKSRRLSLSSFHKPENFLLHSVKVNFWKSSKVIRYLNYHFIWDLKDAIKFVKNNKEFWWVIFWKRLSVERNWVLKTVTVEEEWKNSDQSWWWDFQERKGWIFPHRGDKYQSIQALRLCENKAFLWLEQSLIFWDQMISDESAGCTDYHKDNWWDFWDGCSWLGPVKWGVVYHSWDPYHFWNSHPHFEWKNKKCDSCPMFHLSWTDAVWPLWPCPGIWSTSAPGHTLPVLLRSQDSEHINVADTDYVLCDQGLLVLFVLVIVSHTLTNKDNVCIINY